VASIFTRIIKGEIPCHKVAETEDYLAFLDINPLAKGHTLVIPKVEVDNLFDLQEDTYIGLHLFAKIVAEGIDKAMDCKRVGVAVIGLEVPHAHIHLVPINHVGDINFQKEKLNLDTDELSVIAAQIRKQLPAG